MSSVTVEFYQKVTKTIEIPQLQKKNWASWLKDEEERVKSDWKRETAFNNWLDSYCVNKYNAEIDSEIEIDSYVE